MEVYQRIQIDEFPFSGQNITGIQICINIVGDELYNCGKEYHDSHIEGFERTFLFSY
jgi:hypothetical protein